MEHFASFEAHSISSEKCSIQIDRPTIAIKLDASKFLLVFFLQHHISIFCILDSKQYFLLYFVLIYNKFYNNI